MKAVILEQPGVRADVATVPDPTPGSRDVVVAVRGCGICGTDKHILAEGLPTARYPLIPGHEPWGEVVAVGSEATTVRVGDVVAVDPSLHCGSCTQCRRGHGNLCENWGAIGGTRAGAWAELVLVPASNAVPLGADYPLDCASLIEPVACAVHGLDRLQPRAGRSALVVGGGTMGLILGTLLELAGAEPVTVVELNDGRRRFAAERTGLNVVAPDALGDLEAEYVVDATGAPGAVSAALERVALGGTFMVFGVSSPEARSEFSPFAVYQRELTIIGSMAILHSFGPAVELVRRHPDRFRPLLTHTYALEEFDTAVATLGEGRAIKVVIAPAGAE